MDEPDEPMMQLCCTQLSPATKSSESSVTLTYSWTNIEAETIDIRRGLQSPVFSISPYSHLRWSLRLFENFVGKEYSDLALFLCCEASDTAEVEARFRFRLTDSDHDDFAIETPKMKEYCLFKRGTKLTSYGYKNFCSSLTLIDCTINIHCEIEVHCHDSNIGDVDPSAGGPSKVSDGTLLDDMKSVFGTKKYTDLVVTNNGVSIPAHKAILCARSPVFAAMFEHNTKEQQESRVDISEMAPEALHEMLRFIYTDKVMNIKAVAQDLLAAAEKYALDKLKFMSEKALCDILDVENAAVILILADLHRANDLKTQAIEFINHPINIAVMDTSGFKSMVISHPHLVIELLRTAVTNKDHESLHLIPMEEDHQLQ